MSTELVKGLEHVLNRARASSAAYGAAISRTQGEEVAPWLGQAADEHQQNVRLLVPHIESVLGAHSPTWLAAIVEAGKATMAHWQGHVAMLQALQASEQSLAGAYQGVLAQEDLPIELDSLCRDQLACAEQRAKRLSQDIARADGADGAHERVTEEGLRGVQINTPRAASSENSDC